MKVCAFFIARFFRNGSWVCSFYVFFSRSRCLFQISAVVPFFFKVLISSLRETISSVYPRPFPAVRTGLESLSRWTRARFVGRCRTFAGFVWSKVLSKTIRESNPVFCWIDYSGKIRILFIRVLALLKLVRISIYYF